MYFLKKLLAKAEGQTLVEERLVYAAVIEVTASFAPCNITQGVWPNTFRLMRQSWGRVCYSTP